MIVFEMILGIVFILALAAVLIVRTLFSNRTKPEAPVLTKRLSDLEHKLEAMETRLRNVETITTSKSFQLDREFENLKGDE